MTVRCGRADLIVAQREEAKVAAPSPNATADRRVCFRILSSLRCCNSPSRVAANVLDLSTAFPISARGRSAWILEKFHSWSDSKGDIDQHFTRHI
jgi:hypothetical protein